MLTQSAILFPLFICVLRCLIVALLQLSCTLSWIIELVWFTTLKSCIQTVVLSKHRYFLLYIYLFHSSSFQSKLFGRVEVFNLITEVELSSTPLVVGGSDFPNVVLSTIHHCKYYYYFTTTIVYRHQASLWWSMWLYTSSLLLLLDNKCNYWCFMLSTTQFPV
jgi:hypothetical protein